MSRVAATASTGLWGKPQTGRGGGRHGHALVVHGQDGVERQTVMQGGDDVQGGVGVGQGDDHGPVAHGGGHGLAPWRIPRRPPPRVGRRRP